MRASCASSDLWENIKDHIRDSLYGRDQFIPSDGLREIIEDFDPDYWEWLHDLVFGSETNYDKETNTLTVENPPTTTEITVNKVWDDSNNANKTRPAKVIYQLWKSVNGVRTAVTGKTVELSGTGDSWTNKFEGAIIHC